MRQRRVGHPARRAAVRRRPQGHRPRRRRSTTTTSRSSASRSTCAPSAGRSCCAELVARLRRRHRELRRRRARPARLRLRGAAAIRPDIVYVSNSRLRARGAVRRASSRWGPIAQAVCGLTVHARACPTCRRPAGATRTWTTPAATSWRWRSCRRCCHRNRTGEGQWIDMSCTEAGDHPQRPRAARLHRERPADAARRACPTATTASPPRWRRTASTAPRATTTGSRSPAATTPTGARSRA